MAIGDLTFEQTAQFFALDNIRDNVTHIQLENVGTGSTYRQSVSSADFSQITGDDPLPTLELSSSMTFNITAGSHILSVRLVANDGSQYRPLYSFIIDDLATKQYLYQNDGLLTINSLEITGKDVI